MDNDTSWCPNCDRQIQPKRFQVPVPLPVQHSPAPPPSSPQSNNPRRTTKPSGNVRQRGGLVQGTGRVKPNGTIKRVDSKPQPQPVPTVPVKLRTVIDQGPTPLYCSDECQMADLNRGIPHDFDPQRSCTSSPVSFSTRTVDSDSTASSSLESRSSFESVASTTPMSPSLATLAAIYHFPPLPPPAPVDENETPMACPTPNDYSSGVMMAARRIASELCPKPQKRDAYGHITSSTDRKPIPGWTDGSNAWRSSIYSFTAPNSSSPIPHKSFATRSSRSVQSNMSSASRSRTCASLPTQTVSESDAELLTKFSQSFRRTSRPSTPMSTSPAPLSSSPSSASFSLSSPPRKRERPLLKRGAEGKLLVPEVMMRVNSSGSTTSLSSQYSASSRTSVKSPLSQASSSSDEDDRTQRCDSAASLPHSSKRPSVETRSWSYDNIKTYPIMRLPTKTRIEKRTVRRVVDGVETDVEVEVEVEEKLKRLFLFPAPATVPV
ncbi:hypothetical protein FPV67DRAFT_1479242 [Lyophyllum atratum]|nr:hypothetical protein FPV67DRAFT_1479242 [Lyophyllum atratum]